jgi:hypothetical protein
MGRGESKQKKGINMAWYSGFINIFRSSSKGLVLALIQESVRSAKAEVIKESDKPAIKAAKEEAINSVVALLVASVNKKL